MASLALDVESQSSSDHTAKPGGQRAPRPRNHNPPPTIETSTSVASPNTLRHQQHRVASISLLTPKESSSGGAGPHMLGTPVESSHELRKGGPRSSRRFTTVSAASMGPDLGRFVSSAAFMCDARGKVFTVWPADVALMFVDLSGYSAVAAQLVKQGPHALFAAVNSYFDRIVEVTNDFGGEVITFAGDAMLAMWWVDGDATAAAQLAGHCAAELQRRCGRHVVPRSITGPMPEDRELVFTIHVGLAFGRVTVDVFYDPNVHGMQQAFPFVGGQALRDLGPVVDFAKRGETAGTRSFIEACGGLEAFDLQEQLPVSAEDQDCEKKSDSNVPEMVKFTGLRVPQPVLEPGTKTLKTAVTRHAGDEAIFVHPRFVDRLTGMSKSGADGSIAENRLVAVLFIKQTGDVPVATWFGQLLPVLERHNCSVVQILEDDKGVHIVAAHNLFVSDTADIATAAIDTCVELVDLDAGVCVGASAGTVFCGVVGSASAARWDITGNTCVRACRLMQYAETTGQACAFDSSVYAMARDVTRVRLLDPEVSLKGWAQPSPAYGIAMEFVRAAGLLYAPAGNICAAVNSEAVTAVHGALSTGDDRVRAAIVSGDPGSGKKTVFSAALQRLSETTGRRFVPVLHPSSDTDPPLAIAETLVAWFTRHPSKIIRDLCTLLNTMIEQRKIARAHQLCLDLLVAVLRTGQKVALVVDNAAALDKFSLVLVQDAVRKLKSGELVSISRSSTPTAGNVSRVPSAPALSNSQLGAADRASYGEVIWCICHTPLFGAPDATSLRAMLDFVECAVLRPMTLPECEVLWNSTAAWRSGAGCAGALQDKSGGNPGCMLATWAHFKQSVQRAMQMRKQGKDVPLVGQPAYEGVMYVSEESRLELAETSWFEMSPQICGKLLRLYDTLPGDLRMILRVIGSIVRGDEAIPSGIVVPVSRKLGHDIAPGLSLQANLDFLCELYLLVQPRPGFVAFRLPAMQEAVMRLQTPDYLLSAAKGANRHLDESAGAAAHGFGSLHKSGVLSRSRHHDEDPGAFSADSESNFSSSPTDGADVLRGIDADAQFHVVAARIAKRAGDDESFASHLHSAWLAERNSQETTADDDDIVPVQKPKNPSATGSPNSGGDQKEQSVNAVVDQSPIAVELKAAGFDPSTGVKYEVPPPPATVEQLLERYGTKPMPMPVLGMKNWMAPVALGVFGALLTTLKKFVQATYLHLARGGAVAKRPKPPVSPGGDRITDALVAERQLIDACCNPLAHDPEHVDKLAAEIAILNAVVGDAELQAVPDCVAAAKRFLEYVQAHVPPLVKLVKTWAGPLTVLPRHLQPQATGTDQIEAVWAAAATGAAKQPPVPADAPTARPWHRMLMHVMRPAATLTHTDVANAVIEMFNSSWEPPARLYPDASAASAVRACLRDRTATLVELKANLLLTVQHMVVHGELADDPAAGGSGDRREPADQWAARELSRGELALAVRERLQALSGWMDAKRGCGYDAEIMMGSLMGSGGGSGSNDNEQQDAAETTSPQAVTMEALRGADPRRTIAAIDELLTRYAAWCSNADVIAPMRDLIASTTNASGERLERLVRAFAGTMAGALRATAQAQVGVACRYCPASTACDAFQAALLDNRRLRLDLVSGRPGAAPGAVEAMRRQPIAPDSSLEADASFLRSRRTLMRVSGAQGDPRPVQGRISPMLSLRHAGLRDLRRAPSNNSEPRGDGERQAAGNAANLRGRALWPLPQRFSAGRKPPPPQ